MTKYFRLLKENAISDNNFSIFHSVVNCIPHSPKFSRLPLIFTLGKYDGWIGQSGQLPEHDVDAQLFEIIVKVLTRL